MANLLGRLTERYPILFELVVGVGATVVAALARIAIEKLVSGVIPFVLTFPVVIIATLIAGARSGIIAALGCQLLLVTFVFPHWTFSHGGLTTDVVNLLLATVALLLTIWATASYRTASAKLRSQCEREVQTLSLLIGEMDHRTKNNFQIAAGLLSTQAINAGDDRVTAQLEQASTRLASIAAVYRNLAIIGPGSHDLPLKNHLTDVCRGLKEGMLPSGVMLDVSGDDVDVKADIALPIGLIVNEWVTNAAKYAFPDGVGRIAVTIDRQDSDVRVMVKDDGAGRSSTTQPGTGSKLIASLVEAIQGTATIENDHGIRCSVKMRV